MARYINPNEQYLDAAGNPLSGGKLYFYSSGTLNALTTYSDQTLATPNTQPIVCDSTGRHGDIFYNGSAKVVLKDTNDVQIWERDPVGGDSTGDFTIWSALVTYGQYDKVRASNDLFYISQQAANVNNDPITPSPTYWSELRFVGVYNASEAYAIGEVVQESDGLMWRSMSAANTGNTPSSDGGTNWLATISGVSGTNTGDQVSGDFTHDDLIGFVANEHLDWTTDQGATNIHTGNYVNTTYVSSDFTHDSLTGFVANEHLDWTTDRGATNIHANNYTNSTYTLSSLGFTGATNANYITNNNQLTNGAGYTTNTGDITGITITAGNGLSGGGTDNSGAVSLSLALDANELAVGGTLVGTDHLVASNAAVSNKQLISSIPLSIFNNNSGWTSNTGDITNVTVTAPVAGGGTSGSVNLSMLSATASRNGYMTSAYASKLDGISASADVNRSISDSVTTTSSTTSASATAVKAAYDRTWATVNNVTTNISWTAGTTAGPRCNSSDGSDAVIPSASASASGAVTTGTQTFGGSKTATDFTATSDRTLKSHIVYTSPEYSMDLLMQFQPVTHGWYSDPNGTEEIDGFIAQDVQKLRPSLVLKDEDTGLLSLSYNKVVPITVGAIQKLEKDNKDMKERLAILEKLIILGEK